ncbi:carboxymuconolactone decarboxylase family protein [Novosphingobium beihaiensis]|uniref:Carboxymuconolactone decarboxylase family protein n=1 Tax=Novosphingobium beihaiensis TaxID=2930389 RepID=A0ABT0BRU6_9SPHN|nr:carboxymuconolactone decarboxylase family protein [Novosphingobium beihaiensis]MCJ2187782.1 carboxymuconolactone decarboxylase family protein [Novosphingobium beihaiensis]
MFDPRIKDPLTLAPEATAAMTALESSLAQSGLSHTLLELVKLRISQMNGCAFCIHMHSADLRSHGESELRLAMLPAWREASLYSPRERAALGWAESLTRLADTHAPDAVYAPLAEQFNESEQVWLTMAIGAINTWNRLMAGFRQPHPETELRAAA